MSKCQRAGCDDQATMSGVRKCAQCTFLEQFKPFTSEAVFERDEPSSVAARPCQTIYEASADWVSNQHKHDWYGAGHLMKGERAARAIVNASGKRLTYRQPY